MSPLEMLDRVMSIFDKAAIIEDITDDVKAVIADTSKLLEDLRKLVPMAEEPITVGAPRTHRLFRNFVHNRVVAGAARKFGKSRAEVEAVYESKVTTAELAAVCAEVGVEPPMVGGSFTDWLQNVDWSKVFAIIAKLIALIGPFLI